MYLSIGNIGFGVRKGKNTKKSKLYLILTTSIKPYQYVLLKSMIIEQNRDGANVKNSIIEICVNLRLLVQFPKKFQLPISRTETRNKYV